MNYTEKWKKRKQIRKLKLDSTTELNTSTFSIINCTIFACCCDSSRSIKVLVHPSLWINIIQTWYTVCLWKIISWVFNYSILGKTRLWPKLFKCLSNDKSLWSNSRKNSPKHLPSSSSCIFTGPNLPLMTQVEINSTPKILKIIIILWKIIIKLIIIKL